MKRRDFVKAMAAAGTGLLVRPGAGWAVSAQAAADASVKRVLVMFKCHFDAGFVDTQYNVVHKRYFEKFFPEAIEVARAANAGGERRYVWTTGSWLLFEYLDQASAAEHKSMEEAIARGDIAWHALPFTWQTEMMDQSMIEGSLALSQSLDRRFGKVTTGAKMTDVPGHTRGLIPPLAKHGISFLDIGANPATKPTEFPPLFLWKDPSGANLVVMYHVGYGGVVVVPGADLALAAEVRGDNSGPHTREEIDRIHADLAARFPNAEIVAGNLSEMANAIAPYRDNLPVVTQEIGDTWILGCASDPTKVARYREISRLREEWVARGALHVGDATDIQLLRHVLLEAEHTWGTDTKTWLDYDHYLPADLARMLDTKNYKVVEFSWLEKRQDLLDGVSTLPEPLREEAELRIARLAPTWPIAATKSGSNVAGSPIETTHFVLATDPRTGAITRLRNKANGREWASDKNPIALLTYQTYSQKDYGWNRTDYKATDLDWTKLDSFKPYIEKFGARSEEWQPASTEAEVEETDLAHRILASLEFKDEEAFRSGRASFPRKIFLEIVLPKAEPSIHLHLSCFGKPATRMPEALWLTFNPMVKDTSTCLLAKCGELISPFDVAPSGSRYVHALSTGFQYRDGGQRFAVETLDAPVVSLEHGANNQPDLTKGIRNCLFNNLAATNYIMWYGEDMRFRYRIEA